MTETKHRFTLSTVCRRCGDTGEDPSSSMGRGCPACPAGAQVEREIARMDRAQRERDDDATGQDQEAWDEA